MDKILYKTLFKIVQGNLLEQDVDAIVNAANPSIEGGGGIDGIIHSAAGSLLAKACREYKKEQGISRIEVGEAVITESFNINQSNPRIRYIIHTAGPNCRIPAQNENRKQLLTHAYLNSLEKAQEKGLDSIAFPAISTGIYGYPFEEAQEVVLLAIQNYLEENKRAFKEIRLVYYSAHDYNAALSIWEKLFRGNQSN